MELILEDMALSLGGRYAGPVQAAETEARAAAGTPAESRPGAERRGKHLLNVHGEPLLTGTRCW
jgi:hypothetical protein